jgi:hypothetical protein
MQKVLRFLEANVEWFALGLAVLFLGWTTYTYLVMDPVARTLESVQVSPGSVDSFIDGHAAQRLRDKMDPNAPVPSFDVPEFKPLFQAKIALDGLQPPQLATTYFDYSPFDVTTTPERIGNMGPPVVQLPTIPAAQPLLAAAALDTIPAAAAANGGAANPGNGKDMRLVVAAFTIPWNALYAQWNTSFGPPGLGQQARLTPAEFQVVAVTAYRSEMINGTWTKDEEIEILNGTNLPAYPPIGNKNAAEAYLLALAKDQKTIVAPDFPTVSAGAVWKDPVLFLPNASNPQNGQAPADQNGAMSQPGSANSRTVNTSEPLGTLYAQYRGGGSPGGGYGGPPGGGFRAPPRFTPGPIPPPVAVPTPEQPPSAIPPADGTVDPLVVLANPNAPPGLVPVEPTPKLPNVLAMPAKSPDLCIYIIDESARAGKTYRYRIAYKALNPLWNKPVQRVGKKDQAWVNQFDLESKLSDYSPEIKVPIQTYLFCGQVQGGSKATFPFEVFTWTNGKWLKDIFNASVGDPIGGVDGGTDYSTGWTYADWRLVPRNNKKLVTLVDNDGNLDVRDVAQDPNSPDYKKASQWVDQTKAGGPQPAAVSPVPGPYAPGIPPPGVPPGN